MKWFKHYTDSLDDPFIQGLMDKFSHLGYVVFFGLIEIIAKENGTEVTGKLTVSPAYLRRKLRTTPTRVRQVLDYCQTHGRLMADCSGKEWELCFSKIAKIKDNYTKDLQATGKKLSKHKEKDTKEKDTKEKDKEEEEVKKKIKKDIYGEFKNVKLSPEEYQKLVEKFGEKGALERIENIGQYLASKGDKYKSHYATILSWERKNGKVSGAEPGRYTGLDDIDYSAGLEGFDTDT